MQATSRRSQLPISRIVPELTCVASQMQTQTHAHTQTPTTSRRRQILNSRIVSKLTHGASQTQTLTHTHTNTVYFHGLEKTKARWYSSMLATSRRRQIPIARFVSELTSVAPQTHTHTNTPTHTHEP